MAENPLLIAVTQNLATNCWNLHRERLFVAGNCRTGKGHTSAQQAGQIAAAAKVNN